MPTNEERREVAKELRKYSTSYFKDYVDALCELAICTGVDCMGLDACHGSEEMPECKKRLFDRLADLIEPEPTVDRDALLKLADEMEDRAESYMAQCPGAMKTWVATGDMRVVADKIRKACGVNND